MSPQCADHAWSHLVVGVILACPGCASTKATTEQGQTLCTAEHHIKVIDRTKKTCRPGESISLRFTIVNINPHRDVLVERIGPSFCSGHCEYAVRSADGTLLVDGMRNEGLWTGQKQYSRLPASYCTDTLPGGQISESWWSCSQVHITKEIDIGDDVEPGGTVSLTWKTDGIRYCLWGESHVRTLDFAPFVKITVEDASTPAPDDGTPRPTGSPE